MLSVECCGGVVARIEEIAYNDKVKTLLWMENGQTLCPDRYR